jgi:uncharacterized protein (TIGR02453 family)
MLQASTLTFLEKLSKNNNKPWFDAHHDAYVAAKEDFEALAGTILAGLAVSEPAFKEQNARDCVMRIFRDVRFSADKTPYKNGFGAGFSRGGRKFAGAGYYLHIQPGSKSFAGGGMWMPEAPLLKAVRQEIDYNLNEFTGIIEDKKFKKFFKKIEGEQLKKPPQGFAADNPAIEFLKMKSFTAGYNFSDEDVTNKNFAKKVVEVFGAMKPFIDFLNRAIE